VDRLPTSFTVGRYAPAVLSLPTIDARADVGVFGGSGLYELADHLEPVPVETPYGPPSEVPLVGELAGRRVAFIPRHGTDHRIPAHRVDYRANVWAMAALGVRAVVGPFACGSLRSDMDRGDFVVVDQLVDRTQGREGTFFDGPRTFHLPFADPYDPALRATMVLVGRELGLTVHDGGTVVVIPGPRFSSRAEADWHRTMGWDLVNMTQAPEVALAAEAGLRYVGIGMVTDHDVGSTEDPDRPPVTEDEVYGFLNSNAEAVRRLLSAAIPRLPLD